MEMHGDIKQLVAKAVEGDAEALQEAIGRIRGRLQAFVRARLGAHLTGELDMDDVLQDTYAQAVKSISGFRWRGSESFLRWLNGIAQHVILNGARHQRRHCSRLFYIEHDPRSDAPTPSKVHQRGDRFTRLQEAFDSLSPDYQEAIHLVRIEGLRVKEAAERMNKSPRAVMHLLARGLKKLKDAFGETESLSLPPYPLKLKREGEDHDA